MRAELSPVGSRVGSAGDSIDGAIRMVGADRYCIAILHRIAAVDGSLDGVSRDILES